jgi:hypothetical protein
MTVQSMVADAVYRAVSKVIRATAILVAVVVGGWVFLEVWCRFNYGFSLTYLMLTR